MTTTAAMVKAIANHTRTEEKSQQFIENAYVEKLNFFSKENKRPTHDLSCTHVLMYSMARNDCCYVSVWALNEFGHYYLSSVK